MTLRRLYFKMLWEDVKRKLWAVALLGLALFFALPVGMAMVLPSYQPNEYTTMEEVIERRTGNVMSMLDFGTNYQVILLALFIAALVMGISTFSYLHNKKQIDFYHSLPVKRELWFAVHIGTGILIPAGIYLISAALSLVVAGVNGVSAAAVLPAAVHGFFSHMLYYSLTYITVVLAVIMTGTRLAAVLGSVVFFVYCPMLSGLVESFYFTFFKTYYYRTPSLWKNVIAKISPIYGVSSAWSDGVSMGRVLWALGAILLIGGLSFFLYLRRPSEAAGRTMAFDKSKGFIKVLLVVASGMAGGLFFYAIRETLPWLVFGVIVGVVISHCVIEVIYCLDFKKLFCHEKTMAVCMTAALLVALSFYFDFFRFDAYVPSDSQISYSSIDFGEDSWVSYSSAQMVYGYSEEEGILERGRIANTEAVLGIAREGIRQLGEGQTSRDYDNWCNITVCYTLKGGRKVYRCYALYLDPVMDLADAIYMDPEYKKALYPSLELDPAEAARNMAFKQMITEETFLLPEDAKKREAVIAAYQQEVSELSMSDREKEGPVGELLLISDEDDGLIRETIGVKNRESLRYRRSYWYDGYFYPVYPSFTKTIALLADCGITAGEPLKAENYKGIQVVAYRSSFEEDKEEAKPLEGTSEKELMETTEEVDEQTDELVMFYTDPEEIRAIMEGYSVYHGSKNSMLLASEYRAYPIPVGNMATDADWERDGGNRTMNGFLIQGKVPEFVAEDFRELAKEEKKKD